jgi:hypothetical protein
LTNLAFLENFETGVKDNILEENILKNLEGHKIKILTTLIQTPSVKYIKAYVHKVWNICKMLNFTRNIKDTDNNYYLLRLKDFTCDLFITVFSSNNLAEITLNDVFNLLHIVVDVGTNFLNLKINHSNEGWIKHIDNLMKYITGKIGEIESLIQIEKKFYSIFFDYLNFYLENLSLDITSESLTNLLLLVTKVKFINNDTSTRNFFICLLNKYKTFTASNQFSSNFFAYFENIKNKSLLPAEIINEYFKAYIQQLLDIGNVIKAENLLKEVFEVVNCNTKEELEFYLVNFEIILSHQNERNEDRLKDILNIILDHKELTFEYFDDLMIMINNYKKYDLFFQEFINKLNNAKSIKISTGLSFSYDNIKAYPNLTVAFVYSFLKSSIIHDKLISSQIVFFEVLKNFSNTLLDNFANIKLREDFMNSIPSLLKNLVIFFIKSEEPADNEKFSNFYLLEIIKKLQMPIKSEFINIAIDLYIDKKDYNRLKVILADIPEQENTKSIIIFSKILLLLQDNDKWNSHNNLLKLCGTLNTAEDFHILSYLKIFKFIVDNNTNDFGLLSIIINQFTNIYMELLVSKDYHKLNYREHSLIDIFSNIIHIISKLPNFSKQVIHLMDCFTTLSEFLEFYIIANNENSKLIINEYNSIMDLISLIIDINKAKKLGSGDIFELPEFLLIASCKFINFIFLNFDTFLEHYLKTDEQAQRFKSFIELLEIYKSLSIFYFSYEYSNISSEGNNKYILLDNLFEKYNQIFNSAVLLLKSKAQSSPEIHSMIDEKVTIILNNSNTVQQIIKIKILCKTCCDDNPDLENYIMKFPLQNIENKKFLFVISSVLYQNGLKMLCAKFLGFIINAIFENTNNLIGKIYTLEDIISIYKDYINLLDNKIMALRDFATFLLKLQNKIDDVLFIESIEWILYRVYTVCENIKALTDKDSFIVKNIFDEINIHVNYTHKNKSKSYVLINLLELLNKKFNI